MSFQKGQSTYFQNGTSQDIFDVASNGGKGVYDSPFCFYQWVPATADDELIATVQSCPQTDGLLDLNYNAVMSANTKINAVQLDCTRLVYITLDSEPDDPLTLLITGYDRRFIEYQAEVTIGTSSISGSTNSGFYGITSIEVSSNVGDYSAGISVGTNNYITLPYFSCGSANFVIQMTYNSASISPYTYLTAAANWRTTEPLLTSNDCKGAIQLPSSPNGLKLFTILYWVYGEDADLQRRLQSGDTSAYELIGEPNPASTTVPYPADIPPPLLVQADST